MIKKLIAFTTICCSLLIFILFSALFFIDYNAITKDLITHFKLNSSNIGQITVHKFPFPYINIDSIKDPEKIELEQIKVKFSPWSLLKFKPKISVLKILNAKIYSDQNKFTLDNHEQLITHLITNNVKNINIDITNLSIYNEQNLAQLVFTNCSLFNKNPLSSNINFKATNYDVGQISGVFNQNKDSLNFSININNDNYNFKLSEVYKNSKLISGTGEYQIKNPAGFMYNLIPDLNRVFQNFAQHETVNVKFDILSQEDLLKFENIVISSPDINGQGSIFISKNDQTPTTIKLDFSKIDINSLTNTSDSSQFNNKKNGLRFIFSDQIAAIDISIDQIILFNNETLNKLVFSSSLKNGILTVNKFSGLIGTTGQFSLVGNITQNPVRSLFEGQIYLQHSDFNTILNILGYNQATVETALPFTLLSDLKLTLIDLYLQNFLLQTEDINVTGNIAAKFIGSLPHINSTLNFSSLNLDKQNYPVLSPSLNFTLSLIKNMKNDDYLNKFIPVRTLNYQASLDLSLHQVTAYSTFFDTIDMLLDISPGNLQSSNFDFKHGNNYLSSSWQLIAEDIKPAIHIQIKNGILETNSLTPASFLLLQNKLLTEFSMDKFFLQLNGNIDKITQRDLILENTKFSLENDGTLVKINNLETELLSGQFKSTGNIVIDLNTIDFVYAFNLIDLTKLSSVLPDIFSPLSGGASINGKFSTNGDTVEKQLYNLKTQSQFLIKNTKLNNFSIDPLIEKINSSGYNSQNLDNDLTIALTSGQTNISEINGNIEIQNGIILFKNTSFKSQYSAGALSMAINMYNFDAQLLSMLSFYVRNSTINTNDPNILVNMPINAQGNLFDLKKTADTTELKKDLHLAVPESQSFEELK